MLGAIIGDIVGSRFEFNNHKSKGFDLFNDECQVTDDSIMTLAVAKAIMETEKIIKPSLGGYDYNSEYYKLLESMTIKYMQEIGRKYPDCGYGGMFGQWVFSNNPKPYNSFGNGAAMRISPVGFVAMTESETCELSEIVTSITHNHDEGIKGAEATAVAIFMARYGFTKNEIRDKISINYYPLNFTIDKIRNTYQFNETCQETVPQAIVAFLESTSFEDAIKTAISVGGDSDTLAAITGAIAEAYYGVPEEIIDKALTYLDNDLRWIYDNWCEFVGNDIQSSKFKVLTKYIGKLSIIESYGEWFIDFENDGTPEHPIQMSFVNYNELVDSFVEEFYQFSDSHPEYHLTSYGSILESIDREMRSADIDSLDGKSTLALILGAIRAERFCDGALLSFFKDGSILKWLKRLKDIDESNMTRDIEEIYFETGGYGGYDTYHVIVNHDQASIITTKWLEEPVKKEFTLEETIELSNNFKGIHVEYWNAEYIDCSICDGTQWYFGMKVKDQRGNAWVGSNLYPPKWENLLDLFGIDFGEDEE